MNRVWFKDEERILVGTCVPEDELLIDVGRCVPEDEPFD